MHKSNHIPARYRKKYAAVRSEKTVRLEFTRAFLLHILGHLTIHFPAIVVEHGMALWRERFSFNWGYVPP